MLKKGLKLIRRFLMAMFSVNPHRFDPYKNFKFKVKWDGKYVPGISKISPLARMTEAVMHREGGDPSHFRLSPGTTTYEPIVLERGLSHDTAFEDWANTVFNLRGDSGISLKDYKKDIVIELFNLQGMKVMAFIVYRCWVSEYQALPELNANDKRIAIERIVLQHEGWERDTSIGEPQET
jgi:phage tail-like protein